MTSLLNKQYRIYITRNISFSSSNIKLNHTSTTLYYEFVLRFLSSYCVCYAFVRHTPLFSLFSSLEPMREGKHHPNANIVELYCIIISDSITCCLTQCCLTQCCLPALCVCVSRLAHISCIAEVPILSRKYRYH